MEAHNPEGSYQRNAGFSLKAKGPPSRAEAGWGGLGPPTLRDATMSPIPVQPGWVGSGPLAAGRSAHSTETPLGGGVRDQNQYTGTSLEVQPGTRVCAKSQKPRPLQVCRFQEHHQHCFNV